MTNKTLFSPHFLENRLPQLPDWEADVRPAFEQMRTLWAKARQFGDNWNEAQTEQEFVQPALALLGWEFIVQAKSLRSGQVTRPDYALFSDEAAKDGAYPLQGEDDAFYTRALAIGEAKYWGRRLSVKDSSGRDTWKSGQNPSHQMVSYLNGTRSPWGMLINGMVWRLYSREVSSVASEFYEVDLSALFDFIPPGAEPSPEQWEQFKRWWLFFRRAAFVPDAAGKSFVKRVHEGSATYAREISDKLKELVFQEVMPVIGGGFVDYRREHLGAEAETPESLDEIYRASLNLLYKLLFILYAEARFLLPMKNADYADQSLTRLAQEIAARFDQGRKFSTSTNATPYYERVLALCTRIDLGDPSLNIPRYNGGLFGPDSPENQFLAANRLSDRAAARAIDILVRDAGEPVDYAYISVRNLGAIYEGLLEFRLQTEDERQGTGDGRRGMEDNPVVGLRSPVVLINDKGERKATGSYYTPDYIVAYIVEHTLGPVLEQRDAEFQAGMGQIAEIRRELGKTSDAAAPRRLRAHLDQVEQETREAFLGIRVLAPAMGSGPFLVTAVDYLPDEIIRRMQVYHDENPAVEWDWNPVQKLIETGRREILAEMRGQGSGGDQGRRDDTALLTRLVRKRCIYGVDLNRMAVELAKVSLWLHSFTVGAPLSFLDHHLRWGNSLIGTDVRTVEAAIQATGAGQMTLFAGPFAGLLDLTSLMTEVVERADATLADVQHSAETFAAFQEALTPYKQILDLWVSQHFGNRNAKEFLELFGAAVLPAVKGERDVAAKYREAIERARELWREKRFFHWDLEFPEVFVDLQRRDWAQNPGFDAVVGNPPYVRQEGLGTDKVFLQKTYDAYHGTADLYIYFIERGLSLARQGGQFSMITSNKFIRANYGHALRQYLVSKVFLKQIVDFALLPVFPGITVRTNILVAEKSLTGTQNTLFAPVRNLDFAALNDEVQEVAKELLPDAFRGDSWSLIGLDENRVLEKLRISSLPLGNYVDGEMSRGIITGLNEAFVIDQNTKNRLITQDPNSKEIIKPIVVGSDLGKYDIEFNERYLIWTEIGVNIERYPAILQHLRKFQQRLEKRWDKGNHWYELRPCTYYSDLEEPKIIYPDIANACSFAYDDAGHFSTNTTYFIPRKDHYLLAILNSSFSYFYFKTHFATLEDAKRQAYFRFFGQYMEKLPIRRIAFTTPEEERARLAEIGIAEAAEWIEGAETSPPGPLSARGEGESLKSASLSAFSDSSLGRWVAARLTPQTSEVSKTSEVSQADVIHNLLAHLAEQMIALNKEKQAEMKGFLRWLETEIGCPIDELKRKTILKNYLGNYQKGETHLSFDDLVNRVLKHNKRKLSIDPAVRAFQERLEKEYAASLNKLLPLKAKLAATDRLIDLIVYALYDLTAEEFNIIDTA